MKVSIGCNRKVGADTAILNMCSATDCPSCKLGLCQVGGHKKCYAMKAERIYKNVLPYRRAQEEQWKTLTVKEIIEGLEKLKEKKHVDDKTKFKEDLKYIRFSEAGDFKTQEDVDKMSAIAEGLKGKFVVYGYTARKDLDFSKVSDNMVVNGSNFMVHNNFKAVAEIPCNYPHQCAGDCRICNMCKIRHGVTILIKMH